MVTILGYCHKAIVKKAKSKIKRLSKRFLLIGKFTKHCDILSTYLFSQFVDCLKILHLKPYMEYIMLSKSNLPHLPEFFLVGKHHMDIKFFHNGFSEVLPSFFQKEDPSSVQPWTISFLWLQFLIHLKITTTYK